MKQMLATFNTLKYLRLTDTQKIKIQTLFLQFNGLLRHYRNKKHHSHTAIKSPNYYSREKLTSTKITSSTNKVSFLTQL